MFMYPPNVKINLTYNIELEQHIQQNIHFWRCEIKHAQSITMKMVFNTQKCHI
jgi:hypothetical protein